MSANEIQIGGDHYKSGYQHWDWVEDSRLRYLEGVATKYLARWRKKNGIQDLQKTLHYIAKIKSLHEEKGRPAQNSKPSGETSLLWRFVVSNKIGGSETLAIAHIAQWSDVSDLDFAARITQALIDQEELENAAAEPEQESKRFKTSAREWAFGPTPSEGGDRIKTTRFPPRVAPFGYSDDEGC